MWYQAIAVLALCQILNPLPVQAAATWPASYDEMEDLMMLQTGYRARGFARAVTPCSFSPVPGFRVAAGFLRTAFHDIAAADPVNGVGGLDASIGYELEGDFKTHNNGPAFNATVTYMSQFYNSKASVSDLIALGVYASVRSCGGPLIPIKAGRKDASQAGLNSVPDVKDSKEVLVARFAKLGFSPQEMVQLIACGHSLGGVHRANNPPVLANTATPSNVKTFDTTDAAFDNKVAVEYVDGTTHNPLVVGPPESNSDARIFQVDNNVTIKAMTNPDNYNKLCANVLQRMIEVVPGNVQLSNPIEPYDCKPGQLNLNVVDNGASISFSGEIRIRTSQVSKSNIVKVQLVYKDRTGGSSCGNCLIDTTEAGDASGLDNSFTFYGFSAKIDSESSISSFNVLVTLTSGQTQTFDNNGKGFPIQDSVFVQVSSSSLGGVSGGNQALKVVAAVRNENNGAPQMSLSLVKGQVYNSLPKVSAVPVSMSKLCGDGTYTYYSASYNVPASQVASAKVDVSLGGQVDGFRSINFPSSGAAPQCGNKNSTSSTTATTTTTTSAIVSSTTSLTSSSNSSSSTTTTSSRPFSNVTITSSSSVSFTLPVASTTTATTSSSSTLSSTTVAGISTSTSSSVSSTTTTSSSSYIENPWTEWDPVGPTDGGSPPAPGPSTSDSDVTVTTVVTNTVTTFCPSPTVITHQGQTYTVTSATTLILTWAEPSTYIPASPTNNGPSNPGSGVLPNSNQNAENAVAQVSAIYVDQQNEPAPSGGTDGGNKNVEGLDLNISVTITSIEIPTTTPTADGNGNNNMGGWTVTGIIATPAPGPESTWASGSDSPVVSVPSSPVSSKTNGVATFTGAADSLRVNNARVGGTVAGLLGLLVAVL